MEEQLIETTVIIRRTSKMTSGGRKFHIDAWVVVGDGNGRVGVGHGKAQETPDAIQKAIRRAKKNMINTVVWRGTVPHDIIVKFKATKLLLKPASPGTGIIASRPVRAILEAAGYRNVLTKIIGSTNPINALYATMKALSMMRSPDEVLSARGKKKRPKVGVKDEKATNNSEA
ncbi:MAG: 30S ribosomal protein S5 [Thermotogae bacterium]|nr:30S ribosomal protein S5 [Thermotogota bacterium]